MFESLWRKKSNDKQQPDITRILRFYSDQKYYFFANKYGN